MTPANTSILIETKRAMPVKVPSFRTRRISKTAAGKAAQDKTLKNDPT
jgi:hypothetical protein